MTEAVRINPYANRIDCGAIVTRFHCAFSRNLNGEKHEALRFLCGGGKRASRGVGLCRKNWHVQVPRHDQTMELPVRNLTRALTLAASIGVLAFASAADAAPAGVKIGV